MPAASLKAAKALRTAREIEALPERDLIELAKHDNDAFAELYRRHAGAVRGYLFRRTGDLHATDDLTSETFLSALRGLSGFRSRGVPIRFWLLRIATNAVNRRSRSGGREPVDPTPPEELVDLTTLTPDVHRTDDSEGALRAMLELSPRHQSLLSLHYLEGLDLKEVAVVLRCRIGTVKSGLSRARIELRRRLGVTQPGMVPETISQEKTSQKRNPEETS